MERIRDFLISIGYTFGWFVCMAITIYNIVRYGLPLISGHDFIEDCETSNLVCLRCGKTEEVI